MKTKIMIMVMVLMASMLTMVTGCKPKAAQDENMVGEIIEQLNDPIVQGEAVTPVETPAEVPVKK